MATPIYSKYLGTGGGGGGGSGTVTSIGLTVPSFLSVTPSTITTSGTFAVTLANQSANTVFAGPATGSAAAPMFRALVAADIPAISLTAGVSGILPIANGGTHSGTALTNSKVMISTGGAIVESTTTTTQLGFLDATSSIQTQLNAKAPTASPTFTGTPVLNTATATSLLATGNVDGTAPV